MIPTADQAFAELIKFDYPGDERSKERIRDLVESINLSPAERVRREALIAEFVPSLDDDDLAGDQPESTETPIVEPAGLTDHPAFERDAHDMSPARLEWLRNMNRQNDEPSEIVVNIERAVPGMGSHVEAFLAKRNRSNTQDWTFKREAGYALGGNKRKAKMAVKYPPELRAERKREKERERQRRHRAAKRAGTP